MEYEKLATEFDSIDMIKLIDAWPEHFEDAFSQGYAVSLPENFTKASRVVGLGMGGSGMAYTILGTLAHGWGTVPLEVISDYHLPPYVQSDTPLTAVCVTSFSGNTEETLEAAEQARQRGCPVVCITTGGKLADWAKKYNLGLVQFTYPVMLPRAGLPYTFGIALGVLCKAGFLKPGSTAPEVIEATIKNLNLYVKKDVLRQSAKDIASKLFGKLVYIVGAELLYPVGIRWKGQINENSKQIAFAELMPEMCHNMYLGYQLPDSIRKNSAVVFLDSYDTHPQNRKRIKLVGKVLEDTGVTIINPELNNFLTPLANLIAMIMIGDYASYYLALLNHKDPAEMERIENLKKRLQS